MDDHQLNQLKVIGQIEDQINNKALNFTTVSPVDDYAKDSRIAITSVHFPSEDLINKVQNIISYLREVESDYYYSPNDSLHMTIKNIRIINDPPLFDESDISKAKKVFSEVVPKCNKYNVYFYRLLLFPNNLALMGTTDSELDNIVLSLDKKLKEAGVPDDKVYANDKYFFSNMTLARFPKASDRFSQKVSSLSESINFEPYQVDSVTLLTCNAVLKKQNIIGTWKLKG